MAFISSSLQVLTPQAQMLSASGPEPIPSESEGLPKATGNKAPSASYHILDRSLCYSYTEQNVRTDHL